MSSSAVLERLAANKRKPKPPRFTKKKIAVLLIVTTVLLATLFAFTASPSGIIPEGVSVAGVDVGGLSVEQAADALSQQMQTYFAGKSVKVVHGAHSDQIELADRFEIDWEQTAKTAYLNNTKGMLFGKRRALSKPVFVPLTLTQPDEGAQLKKQLFLFAQKAEQGNGFFTISEDGTTMTVDLRNPTFLIDIDQTAQLVAEQASRQVFDPIEAVTITEVTDQDVDFLLRRLQHEPIDAAIEVVNNQPTVRKEQPGIQIDEAQLREYLRKGHKTFTLSITQIPAAVTEKDLKVDFFQDVLGEHTSFYNASLAGRTRNVTLAANAINGTVLAPGATFSFNRVVGERSYDRGFQNATVFSNGGLEDGVGGGICQVSSTLYSAQLKADLQTVSRRNHMFTVSYVPAGQDATVAYGSIDYVFRNNLDQPIKITASVGGGKLTMKILGNKTDPGRSITIVNQTVQTIDFATETKVDDSLKPGETKVKQNGQNGIVVDTYKVYWQNGVEQKREKIHRSTYSALSKIVLVGAEQQPQASPSATPSASLAPSATPSPKASDAHAATPSTKPSATPAPTSSGTPSDD